MTWLCKLIDREAQKLRGENPSPGEMWLESRMVQPGPDGDFYKKHILSPEYLRDWDGKRPPLIVCLPDGAWWAIDQCYAGAKEGWTVTGLPPCVTVRPSIVSPGYHGWLTDGVLSDDIEGRIYAESDT